MANAGFSRDYKFIYGYWIKDKNNKYIRKKITNVPIYPDDDKIQILLKNKINSYHKAREKDEIVDWVVYYKNKYPVTKVNQEYLDMETKLNQIRQKHWYWEPINYDINNTNT